MQLHMLKAVIQQKTIDRQTTQHPLAQRIPISAHGDHGLRTAACDQVGLISGFLRTDKHALTV